MAAITKLSQKSGIKYRVTINRAGVRPFSRNFKTKKTAITWAKKTEGDLEAARVEGNSAARNLTLATLITELVNCRTINPATVIALTWWKDGYGHELCLLFDKSAVRDALKCLADKPPFKGERKRTNATINRYKASLSSVFEYGREHYDLPGNPCREIKALPVPHGRIRWLDSDEKTALLKACKASDWDKLYLLVTMAITTGARLGELMRVKWADIDFTSRRAYVFQTKNGEPRVLPLTNTIINQLQALTHPIKSQTLIFPSKRKPGKPFEFRKHWIKAVEKAGITNFRFHDLRHTCASYLAQNGATILQIAEVLGHKQLEVTKRYAHLCVDHKQELVDRVLGEVI
jgi:integrase